jgi:hypothetical protein
MQRNPELAIPHVMMPVVRVTISRLLAAALLILCLGAQALEATGRWDRAIQDTGDEAIIVTVVLCIGAALLAAGAIRRLLTRPPAPSAIVPTCANREPLFVPAAAWSAFSSSPPLSLRV